MYQPRLSVVNHQTHVAVIGCGYWGMNYVRVLSELPDSRVTVVCDERAGRLDEVARRFPDVQLTTSIEEALDDDAVEAAVICTQAATHREIAGRALELGKHVLVEKPFTVDVAEADELIELAEKVDRVLLTGHTFLYNGGVRSVQTLMDDDDARRPLLRLCAPHEPRSVPRGRQRALGPRAARRRDLQLPARRHPDLGQRRGRARPAQRPARTSASSRSGTPRPHRPHPRQLGGSHKVREFVVVGSDSRIAFNDLDVVERVRVFDRGVRRTPTTADDLRRASPRSGMATSQPRVGEDGAARAPSGHFLRCIRGGDRPQRRSLRARRGGRHGGSRSVAGENGAPMSIAWRAEVDSWSRT